MVEGVGDGDLRRRRRDERRRRRRARLARAARRAVGAAAQAPGRVRGVVQALHTRRMPHVDGRRRPMAPENGGRCAPRPATGRALYNPGLLRGGIRFECAPWFGSRGMFSEQAELESRRAQTRWTQLPRTHTRQTNRGTAVCVLCGSSLARQGVDTFGSRPAPTSGTVEGRSGMPVRVCGVIATG